MTRKQLRTAFILAILVVTAILTRAPDGSAGALCFGSPVTISGSDRGEKINGTGGPDVIDSGGGGDVVNGLGGDDKLCGGDGGDILNGGDGNDSCNGGRGGDRGTGCERTTNIP
ncbi:MAG: calcium-binding protein [Actinomycetota bacterium]